MTKNTLILLTILLLFSCTNNKTPETSNGPEKIKTYVDKSAIVFKDQFIDGQPINYYLKMKEVDSTVLQYYYGNFEIEENERTSALLDTLINVLQVFYEHLQKCRPFT